MGLGYDKLRTKLGAHPPILSFKGPYLGPSYQGASEVVTPAA